MNKFSSRENTDDFLMGAIGVFDDEKSDHVQELVYKFINTPSPDYTIDFLREMDTLIDNIQIAIDNLDYNLNDYNLFMEKVEDARDWVSYYRRKIFREKYPPKRLFDVDYCMKKHGCVECTAADEFCRVPHSIST